MCRRKQSAVVVHATEPEDYSLLQLTAEEQEGAEVVARQNRYDFHRVFAPKRKEKSSASRQRQIQALRERCETFQSQAQDPSLSASSKQAVAEELLHDLCSFVEGVLADLLTAIPSAPAKERPGWQNTVPEA